MTSSADIDRWTVVENGDRPIVATVLNVVLLVARCPKTKEGGLDHSDITISISRIGPVDALELGPPPIVICHFSDFHRGGLDRNLCVRPPNGVMKYANSGLLALF